MKKRHFLFEALILAHNGTSLGLGKQWKFMTLLELS